MPYYPPVPHPTTPPLTRRPVYIANRATRDGIARQATIRSAVEQVAIPQLQPRSGYCIDDLEYDEPIVFERGPKPIILGPAW